MAPLRDMTATARRGQFRVESLEGRILLAEMAAWVGQNNVDLVARDGQSPDGFQDIDIRLFGLDPTRAIDRVNVQRYSGGLWTASSSNSSNAAIVRSQDQVTGAWSTTADLFLEPYFNDPANFKYELIQIQYKDGSTVSINDLYSTSAVNPNLRVQGDELGVVWKGQDGTDLTGSGVAAGPDGIQDLRLELSNLLDYRQSVDGWQSNFNPDSDSVVVTMPRLDGSTVTWVAGPRPSGVTSTYNRAEVFLNPTDPSRASLYLNPVAGIAPGAVVTVRVYYNRIGKQDISPSNAGSSSQLVAVVNPATDLSLAASAPQIPTYPIAFNGPSAIWLGQDDANSSTPGFVHVTLSGLPAGWAIDEAVLSDNLGLVWSLGNSNSARALKILPLADPTKADLIFPPARDESDALMTLRIRLADGSVEYVSQFHGGQANPKLRDPGASATSITVDPTYVSQPGHDLNTLVQQYGTVRLKAGVYSLSQPLDLVNSVTLIAEPGTTFSFSQASTDPDWSYAIRINKSHTTIDGTSTGGLKIRFTTPIRWTSEFQMNPAVIGSSYSSHNFGPNPKVDLNLRNLDIAYAPPSPTGDSYNFTNVRLIRSNYDDSGVIAGNILQGGMVEVWGGPWNITGNDYRGASAGSTTPQVFAIRDAHDVVVEGNHAHQVDPTGITYSFLLFSGSSSQTIVRNNLVDGGIGRDAAVSPGGTYNFPELILTESYYPHYEGPATVSPASRRILQVSTLRGDPGQAGDIVAILSGPSAGRWYRIAQTIDAQNYLLDGDLPMGDYAVSITRGFVNDVYEGNTLDTTSLAKSSSVAFQLAGAHFGTVLRNNVVAGAKPFFLTAGPTQNSYPGSTAYPTPWGWTHLPVLDLTIDGNTFRDPIFWTPDTGPAGPQFTVAEATLAVEHGGLIRDNQGRLYLTASVTNNQFIYSDSLIARTTGDLTSLRVGAAGGIDPNEMRLTKLSGNTAITSASFAAAGRNVAIRFESGNLAGQVLDPVQNLPSTIPPTIPKLTAVTLNQDGSDLVGRSSTTAPDGLQDVHIVLSGLRTDMAIRTIDIYPYGAGHSQYAAPGLPANTPGLSPGSWRVGMVRGNDGSGRFAGVADLYMQPFMVENGRNHWDITVTYLDGTTAFVSLFGIQVADPSLKIAAPVSRISATSLGQDNSDFVGTSPTTGPDGYQDIHLVLSGLPTDKDIAQVDVSPYGYGRYQYVSPMAPPLPDPHPGVFDRDARNWRAALVRTAIGLGAYSTTADLYVPSTRSENGIQPGTTISNHYDILITFTDGTSVNVAAWGIVGDPNAKVTGLSARSYGQDGSDTTGLTSTPQSDGIQDLHIGLTGLRTDEQVSRVEIWALGSGEWTYQGSTNLPAASLVRASTGAGSFAPTGDLYLAPTAGFVGANGILVPQTLNILVHYADGTTSEQTVLQGVLADPNLLTPVAKSLNQDGHDLARLSNTVGADGQQDIHLVLSNLPTTTPVARVVVRRQGTGETYSSDGSTGSWLAVVVQDQTGTSSHSSTAHIYFEPGPNAVDVDQTYLIEVYLGDSSRRSFTVTTKVTASPGLAMPVEPAQTTIHATSISASVKTVTSSPNDSPQGELFKGMTQPASRSDTAGTSPAPIPPTPASQVQPSSRFPRGPVGHHKFKAMHENARARNVAHRLALSPTQATGPRATAALKASLRRLGRQS